MTPERERLKTAIEERSLELRLRHREVAGRANMSEANYFRVRSGEVSLTPHATVAIEDALEWERGSIQAILEDGQPTPRGHSRTEPRPPRGTADELADQIAELQRLQVRTQEVLARVEELTQGEERHPRTA